jgi:hypothetical protein
VLNETTVTEAVASNRSSWMMIDRPRFAAVGTSGRGGVEAVLVALGDA